MKRCDSCPVPLGYSCAAESHPRYCTLVSVDDRYGPIILRKSGFIEGQIPPRPFPSIEPANGRIKIGLLGPCLNVGGAEMWMLSLLKALGPSRFAWRGVVAIAGMREVNPAMRTAVEAHAPVGAGREAARSLAAECDVVILWAVADVPELLAGLEPKPAIIGVNHSPTESPWAREVNGRMTGIDRLVAVSDLSLAALPEERRPDATVIWNAVGPSRLAVGRSRDQMHRLWGLPPGSRVAGFLGRLSLEKRPDLMARLAASLADPWQVVCVGDGHERPKLAGSPRLHLVGNDLAVGDCLNAFDVLVLPSDYESFCLSMAEATWVGLPVVSTAVGLAKMVPGLARPIPFDADGPTLAAAVNADWMDFQGTGERARFAERTVRERFGMGRFAREWESLICELADCSQHEATAPSEPDVDLAVAKHDPERDVARPAPDGPGAVAPSPGMLSVGITAAQGGQGQGDQGDDRDQPAGREAGHPGVPGEGDGSMQASYGGPSSGRPHSLQPDSRGVVHRAIKFGGSALKHGVDLATRGSGATASPEVQEAREQACKGGCAWYDRMNDSCKYCGCGRSGALRAVGIDLKLKRSWASETCPLPLPKWRAV